MSRPERTCVENREARLQPCLAGLKACATVAIHVSCGGGARATLGVAAVLTLVAAVQAAQKPYPIFTPAQLDATMKTLGPNVAGIRASLTDGDFTTAKERVIRSREQLAVTVTFWRDNGRDDAVTMLRTTLERMDALDAALSAEAVDATVVDTLATEIGGACAACHAVYREQDPTTREYQINSSALANG